MARLLKFPLFVRLARLIYGESVDELGHINLMTHHQLQRQIADAGFVIEEQTDLGFYLPVVAEFGGQLGARFCRWVSKKLANTRFSGILWTQCYVLRRPAP